MKPREDIKLNSEQLAAVENIEGPTMVIAGPGTGKTQVLTARIANILQKTDTDPDAVLALTFTESGVRAMRQRLLEIIGTSSYYVNIHTFHSFCSDIIRLNPDRFLTSIDLEPLSDLERVQIFTEILDKNSFTGIKPYRAPYLFLKSITSEIKNLKREGITPEKFEKILKESEQEEKYLKRNQELLNFYHLYQKKLAQRGRYDFEDMINWVIAAFEKDKEFLAHYQERFHYFLIDEYQDTNTAQNTLIFYLAAHWGQEANLFVVGDEDQSIYRFQGASLENILNFKERFPNASVITLKENYRTQQTILNAADSLIRNNKQRITNIIPQIDKTLESQTDYPLKRVKIGQFTSNLSENLFIAEKIKELTKTGVKPSEIAVIYRHNNDSQDIAHTLTSHGIKYSTEGGENILNSPYVKILIRLFNVIHKTPLAEDDDDLFHVLNYEFLDLNPLEVLKICRFASRRRINLFEAINHPEIETVTKDLQKFKDFVEKITEWNANDKNQTFIEFFETVINEGGYLSWALNHPDKINILNKLNSLFSEVKRLNRSDHDLNLKTFLGAIDLMDYHKIAITENELFIGEDAVVLTTAHKAKGKEYEYVFIVNFYDQKWGNNRTVKLIKLPEGILKNVEHAPENENEDERRLFYVSLTRAKKDSFITTAKQYYTSGSVKEAFPSMFLSEIKEDYTEDMDTAKYDNGIIESLEQTLERKDKTPQPTFEEKKFLRSAFEKFKLSPTSLNTYLQCAYKFKLKELFKTPRVKDKNLCLGSAVHSALEKFGRSLRDGKLPNKQFLIDRFNESLRLEIMSPSDLQETQKQGETLLEHYYEAYKEEFVSPLHTELKIGMGSRFVPFIDKDTPIQGKIDKVESIDANNVRIVDYKTGNPKTRNEIEGKTKNSTGDYKRQLVFYKLLCDLDKYFDHKVAECQIDFVESPLKGKPKKETFVIQKEEIEELKALIRDVMKKIRELNFPRTTDYSICKNCEFKDHCWPYGIPVRKDQ